MQPIKQDKIDNEISIETPEGIELKFAVAGPVARFYATLLDNLILFILIMIIVPMIAIGSISMAIWYISAFVIYWFLPTIFEWRTGATPGKRAVGLLVINDDGTPVSFHAAFMRNLLRFVDALPVPWLAGFICMCMHKDNKRLGDMAAGTLVIYNDKRRSKAKASPNKSVPELEVGGHPSAPTEPVTHLHPAPPPWRLSKQEQRAIINFAERQSVMSKQRSQELADILLPDQADNVARILSYAAWLKGERVETAAV